MPIRSVIWTWQKTAKAALHEGAGGKPILMRRGSPHPPTGKGVASLEWQ